MALLLAKVDPDLIRLVGWWRSDVIMCYLHTTAKSFNQGIAARMVSHGNYALIPLANLQGDWETWTGHATPDDGTPFWGRHLSTVCPVQDRTTGPSLPVELGGW